MFEEGVSPLDLTHPLREGMAHPPMHLPLRVSLFRDIDRDGAGSRVTRLDLMSHSGTHIDAPSHTLPDGASLDAFGPERLWGPAVCVAVEVTDNAPIDVDAFDTAAIRAGDAVFIATGWDRYLSDDRYYDHPYLTLEAARFLVEAGVRLVGSDTLTPELPSRLRDEGFDRPIHRTLLGSEVLIVENVANLTPLGNRRFYVVIAPLPIADADGAPCRLYALPASHEAGCAD